MAPQSSAPWKKKRTKLLDVILNANWLKQSQHAANIIKLHKILLVCDANFLDEKTGESPLTLLIGSHQINPGLSNHNVSTSDNPASSCRASNSGSPSSLASMVAATQQVGGLDFPFSNAPAYCPPQSASLFDLQCQSTGLNQHTNISDLSHSQAPLIERLILLFYKCGAQLDFRNRAGRTPLHVAAMKSNFWALNMLLELGAPTDHRDINGLTPLYYSIIYKADLKVTKLLLNHQSSAVTYNNDSSYTSPTSPSDPQRQRTLAIGIIDQHGWQETHQACKLGLDAHLEKLLYYGCDINAKISGSGNTPLHVAAINDQLECAKVLLMRGADKTITNNSHQTAHQVAVISNNMDLAEFIAEHDQSKVIPFRDKPVTFRESKIQRSQHSQQLPNQNQHQTKHQPKQYLQSAYVPQTHTQQQTTSISNQSSTRSSLTSSHSMASLSANGHQHQQRAIVQPQVKCMPTNCNQLLGHMNPLSLDLATTNVGSFGNGNTSQPQSLISIGGSSGSGTYSNNQQLNVHLNNVSPCLSQRSCATSNTTSSSGVCCDGDGNNSAEDAHLYQHLVHSQSQHSNITIINIGNDGRDTSKGVSGGQNPNVIVKEDQEEEDDDDDDDDLKSSASSLNDGLCSLMSDERPLLVGTAVEAISEYQSGDPTHLQLHRGDQIEILECTPDLLHGGQLPRLANKPMLYGRLVNSEQTGLFPSFCVQRARKKRLHNHPSKPLADLTFKNNIKTLDSQTTKDYLESSQIDPARSLTESRSMMIIDRSLVQADNENQLRCHNLPVVNTQPSKEQENDWRAKFREVQVTLSKSNDGFGFVLRGAKVDMTTLASSGNSKPASVSVKLGSETTNKLVIDERLMAANNLVSLQYLDEIETGSVAYDAGLKRGDFLVAVNGQDVRLGSHEQVVQMIRQSGNQVHLTIATPISNGNIDQKQQQQQQYHHQLQQPARQPQPTYTSRTLNRVKPEPPKRDPTTTLTRNRAGRVKSMMVQPQLLMIQQQEQQQGNRLDPFDANKPLPIAPPGAQAQLNSPTGSLNMMSHSVSSNLMHFHSAQSLSSTVDTQSISSISTISADHAPQQELLPSSSQQATPTHSSSSTTTLTTVAATNKPKIPPKTSAVIAAASSIGSISSASNSTDANDCSEIGDAIPKSVATASDMTTESTIYQPAVVTTTKRISSSGLPLASSVMKPTIQTRPSSPTSYARSQQSSQSSLPPPPPPPLPDFSSHPQANRLNQRRTSAPINATPALNGQNLMRKRESLATIGNLSSSLNHKAPSQIGAVAAACAAAANNRMQRRQQEQTEKAINLDTATSNDNTTTLSDGRQQPEKPELVPPERSDIHCLTTGTAFELKNESVCGGVCAKDVKETRPNPVATPVDRQQQVVRQQLSATLGRKSSAQIIQQPKPNFNQASQSQTLRPKPKRPSIPSYDELPPPPSPLPPVDPAEIKHSLVEQQLNACNTSQPFSQIRPHQLVQQQHLCHENPVSHHGLFSMQSEHSADKYDLAPPKRQSYSMNHQGPILSQQQQEIIRQQLMQQHLIKQQQIQKHQNQIRLQQQLQHQHQLHQRDPQHRPGHQHNHQYHQLHNSHQAQRMSHATTSRELLEQQLLQRQLHHQHHHHHHNHHMTTQEYGSSVKGSRVQHPSHNHHHHHHHHHNVQEHQAHHMHSHRPHNQESYLYF